MITGIAHLTMEGEQAQALRVAAGLGFTPGIIDDVVLPPGFEALEDDTGTLPLALLHASHGLRLEVVTHPRSSVRRGAWCGLFAHAPLSAVGRELACSELSGSLRRAGILVDPVHVELDVGRAGEPRWAEAWLDRSRSGENSAGLVGLLARTDDVPSDAAFWASFARVRWESVDSDMAWGWAPLPMPRETCTIVLVADSAVAGTFAMNDAGFPSIGVHSTSVERDCRKALESGATMRASPIVTSVGGRTVRMALVSAPGGAPIELLGVERTGREN